jgi:hypothetical protein
MRIDLAPRVLFASIAALGVGGFDCLSVRGEDTASENGEDAAAKRAPLASVYRQAGAQDSGKSKSRRSTGSALSDNPALEVQRFLRSSTGGSLGGAVVTSVPSSVASGATARASQSLGTPSPPVVSPRDASGGGPGTEPPPLERAPQPLPTSLGTARYIDRYQATRQGLNYLEGSSGQPTTVTLPSGVYAGGGYLSGAPLGSNPYYPSGPVAPQRPFDNYMVTSPGAELYHRYWPLMLDRDADGDYQLDAVDIYFMLQGGY